MLEMLQGRLGLEAPKPLVIPERLETLEIELGARQFEVVEFGESEAKHIAALLVSERRALLSADIARSRQLARAPSGTRSLRVEPY
jgi:hypothetical protein